MRSTEKTCPRFGEGEKKDGLSDERELMLDWKTGEIMRWANPD
ncbi:hypothetical protein [Bacillus safensis]|nr:hypothetical protein [Bacillus safensis]